MQAVLRSAYALGVDRAIHVKCESTPPLLVSQVLAKLAQREDANLLILGKQAIDSDNNQTVRDPLLCSDVFLVLTESLPQLLCSRAWL